MIIIRIIYLYDGNNPDDLIKKIHHKEQNEISNNRNTLHAERIDHKNTVLNFKKEFSESNKKKSNQNYKSIKNFREFVDMFFKNREGILHNKLYNDVSMVSFKDGEVVINTSKISDTSFNRNIAKLISTWTGRIWKVNSSTSNIGKSLYEEDIINQQKEIELMKNNSEIKKILKEFPKSEIHSITELSEVNSNEENIESEIKKEK